MYQKRDWLIFFIISTLIFLAAGRMALDTDFWWHVRAGEETLRLGYPLTHDPFSITQLGESWINHSWFSQVILYIIFTAGGFFGLGLLVALVVTLSMVLIYFQMAGKPIMRAFLLVLGTLVAAVVWSPRPQIFSLLFFSITGLVLHQFKWLKRDYLHLLPIIFLLWSNLHAGYALGLILIGVVIAGELINRVINPGLSPVISWQKLKKLIIIAVLCGLAVVINPNGLNMWLIPFQTVEVRALQQLIQEWASPDFHALYQQPFLWLLFATLAAMAFSGRKADAGDVLLVLVFGYMGLVSRRNFAPFALAVIPVLSRYLWIAFNHHLSMDELHREAGGRFIPHWQRAINLSLVGLLFAAGLAKVYTVNHPVLVNQEMSTTYPVGAVAWIKANKHQGNLLNEYNWGGYLSWELKEHKIFIDGRTDLYGDCIINEWMHVMQGGEFSKETLNGYQVSITVVEPQQPIVSLLLKQGWVQGYRDQWSVVLVRP